ncbi:endonuclease YncB(thermonuclease family) [Bradyrhizobium sp. USDA 10063]
MQYACGKKCVAGRINLLIGMPSQYPPRYPVEQACGRRERPAMVRVRTLFRRAGQTRLCFHCISCVSLDRLDYPERHIVRRVQLINTALYLVALLNGSGAAAVTEFEGVPRIIDGDTVQFGGAKLQLNGIDAPQLDQSCLDARGFRLKCGVQARERLETRAGGRIWVCTAVRQTSSGLLFGHCEVNGEDIGRQMVQSGWAIASTTGSVTYLESEALARASAAGLWSRAFIAPVDWRQHNWHATILGRGQFDQKEASQLLSSAFGGTPPSPDCEIKGNESSEDKCIFHKPGGVGTSGSRSKRGVETADSAQR